MDLNKKRIEPDFDGQYTRQGKSYMYGDKEMGDGPVLPKDRPGNMFVLSECRNILIRDVIIKDSPVWTIHIADSSIFLSAMSKSIMGSVMPIMMAFTTTSRNIHISNCDIKGDDGIVLPDSDQEGYFRKYYR
jgi:polygalacturonase